MSSLSKLKKGMHSEQIAILFLINKQIIYFGLALSKFKHIINLTLYLRIVK